MVCTYVYVYVTGFWKTDQNAMPDLLTDWFGFLDEVLPAMSSHD